MEIGDRGSMYITLDKAMHANWVWLVQRLKHLVSGPAIADPST
jgi:hypothetical protein